MITHFRQAIEETLPCFPLLALTQRVGSPVYFIRRNGWKPSSNLKKEWQQAGWKHVSMKWGIYTVA